MELIVLLFVIIGIIVIRKLAKKRRSEQAQHRLWSEYRDALRSGDKQSALRLGRQYYSDVRGGKLSMYDEEAMNNDLAAMEATNVQPTQTTQYTVADELTKLKEQLDKGIITADEFQTVKNKLITKFD